MKQLLLLLISLLTSDQSYFCASASQNRLFPLGVCSKGLVVVETQLSRGEYFKENWISEDEIEIGWFGKGYLKIYNNDYKLVHSMLLDSIRIEEKYYNSVIGKIFNKGFLLAKNLPDFSLAKPVSISFCDYQQTCSKASLVFDNIKNQISIRLPNKIQYPINILSDTLSSASNLINYYKSFDGEISANTLKEQLYINSVRNFQIGQKRLTIVHLGIGQRIEYADVSIYPAGKEYDADFAFVNIKKSIYDEPVLHHGHGFDFFILE